MKFFIQMATIIYSMPINLVCTFNPTKPATTHHILWISITLLIIWVRYSDLIPLFIQQLLRWRIYTPRLLVASEQFIKILSAIFSSKILYFFNYLYTSGGGKITTKQSKNQENSAASSKSTCICPNCQEYERMGYPGKPKFHLCHIAGCGKQYSKPSHLRENFFKKISPG